MRLDDLPDDIKTEHNSDDDVFILDGTITSLKLIYSDGSIVDKAITDDLAMKIYELLSQEL